MRRFIILLSFYTTVVKGGDSNNNIIEYLDTLKFELGLSVNEEETSKSCWLNPGLLNSCTDTDMNQRQRMAIKLSNCHMSEAGLETFECHPDTDLSVCKLHLSKSQVGVRSPFKFQFRSNLTSDFQVSSKLTFQATFSSNWTCASKLVPIGALNRNLVNIDISMAECVFAVSCGSHGLIRLQGLVRKHG